MYIGKEATAGNFQKCDAISVVNGQAAYTLQVGGTNVNPESANHMLVSLNGILQAPVTSFTVAGSTLTFASNLATGDVIDFVMILGDVLNLQTVSDGTITNAKLAQDIISGETDIGADLVDADLLLVDDGAGGTLRKSAMSRIKTYVGGSVAGSPIMIMKGDGSDQSISTGTFTKMTNLTAEENSDGLYDTSADTVTIPSGKGGKYLISIMTNMTTTSDFDEFAIRIRKNGSDWLYSSVRNENQETNGIHAVRDLAASDVLEVNIYHNRGSNAGINGQAYRTLYSIVRLAE